MNLIYYKADIGNFGDDLNPWLWEKIFGDFSEYQECVDFYGIGSILDSRFESENRKIIFGSGIRDFLFNPQLNENTDVRFVRGPISAKVFGNCNYITDAAYCLGLLERKKAKKKYSLAYMPYFRHVPFFNWGLFEKYSGIKVIIPTNSVEQVLQEIDESEQLLTSAMHGAIVADIYRVPWMRVKLSSMGSESSIVSELKWCDWYKSLNFEEINSLTFGFTFNYQTNNKLKDFIKGILLAYKLKKFAYHLSADDIYKERLEMLQEQISSMKENYLKR